MKLGKPILGHICCLGVKEKEQVAPSPFLKEGRAAAPKARPQIRGGWRERTSVFDAYYAVRNCVCVILFHFHNSPQT